MRFPDWVIARRGALTWINYDDHPFFMSYRPSRAALTSVMERQQHASDRRVDTPCAHR